MYRLKQFGGLLLVGPEGVLTGAAAQRRSLALLAVIGAGREHGVTRAKIAGLLWSESDDERSRATLAQTVYRVRRELGGSAVLGGDPLRLNPEGLVAEAAEFESAIERGELEQAVALYTGPFLDGFYVPGVPEFERWTEEERSRLAQRHRDALEQLATRAAARGAHAEAAAWWRALAGVDPLNARVAARLVEALAASGDASGALQAARIHETLVRTELNSDPDPVFLAAVASTRPRPAVRTVADACIDACTDPSTDARIDACTDAPIGPPPSAIPAAPSPAPTASARPRRRWWSRRVAIGAAVAAAVTLVIVAAAFAPQFAHRTAPRTVVAVGEIADLSGGTGGDVVRALPELLAANLARLDGIDVVSRGWLYDLAARPDGTPDAGGLARAARQAGARTLLDGSLYRRADGSWRIQLRLTDVASGVVQHLHEFDGQDPFALADSAAAPLAADFGIRLADPLRAADVTTHSLVALRLYEEGLRAFYRGDAPTAAQLFDAALHTDSTFAMAAYYAYRSTAPARERSIPYLDRARRLARRTTTRERLIIEATWADLTDDPSRLAIARTLTARYPGEPEGHVLLGNALVWAGDFPGALVAYRTAVAMDSGALRDSVARCVACDGVDGIVTTYLYADSLAAAERAARQWTQQQPGSARAWHTLATVRQLMDDTAGTTEARAREGALQSLSDAPFFEMMTALRVGDFARAELVLDAAAQTGSASMRREALWWLTITHRYQGRLDDARLAAMAYRRMAPDDIAGALLHAQVLVESHRGRAAAALLDSVVAAVRTQPALSETARARALAWTLTHTATALAAAGDTTCLAAIANDVQAAGSRSGFARDRRLHHYVRGMLLAARHRPDAAIAELRQAIFSPAAGYTRVNVELARLYLAQTRPRDAIPLLRAALHGPLEASNLYVTHTELHALLAQAFMAVGQADSAAVHQRYVAQAR